jgi:hypothetical protein
VFIGLDFFGSDDGYAFNSNVSIGNINIMKISNIIADEIKIDEGISDIFYLKNETSSVGYGEGGYGENGYGESTVFTVPPKEEWGYTTLLLGKFANSLESGNIDNKGIPVEKIRIKRRNLSELNWTVLKDFDFVNNQELYELNDRYTPSYETLEYSISPMTASIEGKANVQSVESQFNDTFLLDKDNTFKLKYDLNISDIENVSETSVIHTLGNSRFPAIFDSNIDYKKSGITTTLISIGTENNYGVIDDKNEIVNRKNIMAFLKNKKPKLLKSSSGLFYCVRILEPREVPMNDLSQRIWQVNFQWIEIAESDIENLKKMGLTY